MNALNCYNCITLRFKSLKSEVESCEELKIDRQTFKILLSK